MAMITGCDLSPRFFLLILRYCANLKAVRYESTSLNRNVADKSHRVVVAYVCVLIKLVSASNKFLHIKKHFMDSSTLAVLEGDDFLDTALIALHFLKSPEYVSNLIRTSRL